MDDAKIRAEIQNLKAHINQLQIRLENKHRTLERNRPLVERNVISRQRFDDLESEIKEIKAQIIQAQAGLVRQKEFLSYTVIRAPFTGIAGARTFSVGQYLKVGEPVVHVIDLDPLEITFQVPEKFKTRLSAGHEVVLNLDPYPNRSFKGIVSFISPQVDINTRTFQVKALVKKNILDASGIMEKDIRSIIFTGYGRTRVKKRDGAVTEITCHAKGIKYVIPETRILIDIGG